MTPLDRIRNLAVIAHIDHGKSTLSDRILELTDAVDARDMREQYLDSMDLEIVPVLNKIDLPAADPDRVAREIEHVLGIDADTILRLSAKTGEGVPELLDAVVERIPAPVGDADASLQALLFDSYYDQYRGVVSAVRVMNGTLSSGARLRFMQAGSTHDVEEVGVRLPAVTPVAALGPGEVGYLIAGIKDVGEARSGE